jgi:uncharacterized protein GlcG (DUF336 family)
MARTPACRALATERLEDRLTPAAVAALAAGTLTVVTDNLDQRVAVTQEAGELVVRANGEVVTRTAAAGVTQLAVTTGAGNDRIEVAPDVTVPVTADAGPGRNVVKAGGGPATVQGGADIDKLGGGSAASLLTGNGGVNRLVGGTGANTFTGGAGANTIVGVRPGDTVNAGAADRVERPFAPRKTVPLTAGVSLPTVEQETLTADEVRILLDRASAATPSRDAIIAIVDRNGRILGVRVEDGVAPEITGNVDKLVFAVDGALAKARTVAFFGTDAVPLTSRIIGNLAQSTITEREVNSDPSITDPNSTLRGPGFVAPVSPGGHFPPGIANTPAADIFGIEHTNRDASASPGPDRIKGTADDIPLPPGRFNIDPNFVPFGQTLFPPDSFGTVSGLKPGAQARGLATLPGGIPIIKNNQAVGGLGVFFPGKTGYATEENSALGTTYDPTKPDRSLEAEFIAFATLGGTNSDGTKGPQDAAAPFPFTGPLGDAPALPAGFENGLPFARVDLVGITLNLYGPGGTEGPANLVRFAQALGGPGVVNGTNLEVTPGVTARPGFVVPEGWLVTPHDGDGITAAEVEDVIVRGVLQSLRTRSAVRAGANAVLIHAVTDRSGNVVGLYRMPDATNDALDVTVAKARNAAYLANPAKLQPEDELPGVPRGTAISGRTLRYVAQPRFPIGIDGEPPAPYSIFNDGGSDPLTGRTIGDPLPASAFQSAYGYDAFNPGTNFRQRDNLANQNGVAFFPAGVPLYRPGTGELIGGYGTSGDGVDQNDIAAFAGSVNFGVPANVPRADQTFVRGVRLPYQKFGRNPEAAINGR